jgi:hypothetical protein
VRFEAELTSFQHKKSEIAVPEENLTPDEPYNISYLGRFWLVVVQKWNGYGFFGGIRFVSME